MYFLPMIPDIPFFLHHYLSYSERIWFKNKLTLFNVCQFKLFSHNPLHKYLNLQSTLGMTDHFNRYIHHHQHQYQFGALHKMCKTNHINVSCRARLESKCDLDIEL
jgi:hypothetical protein